MSESAKESTTIEESNLVALYEEPTGLFHNLVSASGLDPKKDFRNRNLRSMHFAGAEIDGFDFSGSDLRGTNIRAAKRIAKTNVFTRALLDEDDRQWLNREIGDILESFEIIARYVSASPTEAPVEFVRELAQRWKERGGYLSGKPRHSDRYLDDLLRWQGTPIRSLTPKLVGRTNLKSVDADVLVRLFLSHWDYVGNPDSGEISARSAELYKPLLSDAESEGVCAYVTERISEIGAQARSRAETGVTLSVPGQDTSDLIATEFQKAAAYFQIGAGQTVLVARPEGALIGFRDLVNRLRAIDGADSRDRILIWTLDLGRRDFEDPESRLRFMNVEALISRFKALKLFVERNANERWDWLRSKTVIVLHDTRSVRPDVPRIPLFDPHHVLFSAIPPRWAGSPEFIALYGTERLQETNYTVFLRRTAEGSSGARELSDQPTSHGHQNYELRYFGHALVKSDEKGDRQPRGLELNAPGRSYVEALGTVFVAAASILGLQSTPAELSIDGMTIDPRHAIEKLRHHGFLLLRLDEFMHL
jgi:hypothetical protein